MRRRFIVAVTASCTHTTPALLEIPTVFTPCSFLFVDLSARLEGETDELESDKK